MWVKRILLGGGGLRAYFSREAGRRPSHQEVAEWVVRCLANPRCEGSSEVLQAIQERRKSVEDEASKEQAGR